MPVWLHTDRAQQGWMIAMVGKPSASSKLMHVWAKAPCMLALLVHDPPQPYGNSGNPMHSGHMQHRCSRLAALVDAHRSSALRARLVRTHHTPEGQVLHPHSEVSAGCDACRASAGQMQCCDSDQHCVTRGK